MTLLVQITDTHIVQRGTLLYGMADTARHLAEAVTQINAMRPRPDLVLHTGDLVEHPGPRTYSHFRDLIAPLQVPIYLMPGNHDDPAIMAEFFGDSDMFPGEGPHYQYAIEGPDFRTLMLNSHFDNSELPFFGPRRLQWLEYELESSDQVVQVAEGGHGLALGRRPLVDERLERGTLVAPFGQGEPTGAAYYLCRPAELPLTAPARRVHKWLEALSEPT